MDADPQDPGPDRSAQSSDPATLAAEWVARRDAGLCPDERRQLQAWLAASPQNAAAFATADTSATELDWPLHLGAMDEVIDGLAVRARRRQRRRVMQAGGVVAALMLLGTIFLQTRIRVMPETPGTSVLVVKTPERAVLPDGSVVELKDGAKISVHFTEQTRSITLLQGTAHFQVMKQPRPFVVSAAGVTAEALGTAFSVELEGPSVSVLVTQGRVAVNKEPEPVAPGAAAPVRSEPLAVLDAGKAVSVSLDLPSMPRASAIVDIPVKDVEDRLAWRIPRLEFSGTPLRDVVAMVNRHNAQQIAIAERSLESLELSGIVRADKVDALLDLLQSEFSVKCERTEGRIVLRTAR